MHDEVPQLRVVRFVQLNGATFDMYIADHERDPGALVGRVQFFISSTASYFELWTDGVRAGHGTIEFGTWGPGAAGEALRQIANLYYPDALVDISAVT